MYNNIMEMLLVISFFILVLIYLLVFYIIIIKRNTKFLFLRRFHNAVCNIYEAYITKKYVNYNYNNLFNELKLNYEKLCQTNPNKNFTSILDLLETIIYYYDSYSDVAFKNIFRINKNLEVKIFMVNMCDYINNVHPFISISQKESELMQSIMYSINDNNKSLGLNSLNQLSQEIAIKEKLIIKKNKENQISYIVSIVGVILTIIFGIMSFIK